MADKDEAFQQALVLTVFLFTDVVMPFSSAGIMRSNLLLSVTHMSEVMACYLIYVGKTHLFQGIPKKKTEKSWPAFCVQCMPRLLQTCYGDIK